jgi:hypothetical protein
MVVGEEIDERAGGRFYGIAVGIDSVRLDGSQVPGEKNADLAIKWRYRDPTHDPARARPPRHRARPGYRRGARRILPTLLPLPGLAECRRRFVHCPRQLAHNGGAPRAVA